LTRVALPEGELVVNSSQGGGSKDTWVLGHGSRDPRSAGNRGVANIVADQATIEQAAVDRAEAEQILIDEEHAPPTGVIHQIRSLPESSPHDSDAGKRMQQQEQQQQGRDSSC
jgi:hypothetical protein